MISMCTWALLDSSLNYGTGLFCHRDMLEDLCFTTLPLTHVYCQKVGRHFCQKTRRHCASQFEPSLFVIPNAVPFIWIHILFIFIGENPTPHLVRSNAFHCPPFDSCTNHVSTADSHFWIDGRPNGLIIVVGMDHRHVHDSAFHDTVFTT